MKRTLLLLALVMFLGGVAFAGSPKSGKISCVRINHNVSKGGHRCMAPEFKVNVEGYKNKDLNVVVYFYDENGNALKDKNSRYCTIDGQVSSSVEITPGYDNSIYESLKIYIPTDELHVKFGKQEYSFMAVVWKGKEEICRSARVPFSATRTGVSTVTNEPHYGDPSGSVLSVRLEPSTIVDGKEALKVNLKGNLKKLKGEQAYMAVWIYDNEGRIYDTHASNRASDGGKFFKWNVVPESEDYTFNVWYAPYYHNLNLKPGNNTYKVVVTLNSPDGTTLATSETYSFSATGAGGNTTASAGSSSKPKSSPSQSTGTSTERKSKKSSSGTQKPTKKGTDFYAVQTMYSSGVIESGGPRSKFNFMFAGGLVGIPAVDGNVVMPANLDNRYPEFANLAVNRYKQFPDDEGSIFVSDNGLTLYYINETKGIANVLSYLYPGKLNSFFSYTHYSTDPSKANSGDSGYINLNPTLDDFCSGSSSSNNSTTSKSSTQCPKCYGRKWRPESYTHSASADSYHWLGGRGCQYCNRIDDHYHYRCHYCD